MEGVREVSRYDRIRRTLQVAADDGLVRGAYSYSMGDGWRRWSVEWTAPLSERVYTTREVECVCDALTVARDARRYGKVRR